MEAGDIGNGSEKPASRAGKTAKWALVLVLAVAAGIGGYYALFRTHPAQATVEKAFAMVEEGDMEGLMECIDPEGQLGRMWEDNQEGARDLVQSMLDRYRVDFSSLSFATRAQGGAAEVELKGGRVTLYDRDTEGPPAAFFDLGGSDLVFYVEKRGDSWLIEGVNYDITEILSGQDGLLPF